MGGGAKMGGRSKVANVFGQGDSDDEGESTRRQIELAQKKKTSAAFDSMPLGGSSGSGRPVGTPTARASEIHNKLLAFKQSCKNKYIPMPEDLRREVESVMGTS